MDLSGKAKLHELRRPLYLQPRPSIVSGVAKQRSSRCAAALIRSQAVVPVSLTLMIQPSSHPGGPVDPEPLRDEPGSAEAEGAVVVTRASCAPRSDDDTMLDAERKAESFISHSAARYFL